MLGGCVGLCYALVVIDLQRRAANRSEVIEPVTALQPRRAEPPERVARADPGDREGLVEEMLADGRYALLLRPQLAAQLQRDQFRRALGTLTEQMALVPEGEVVLGRIDAALDDRLLEPEEIERFRGRVVNVAPVFLDRYPVTNRQYYLFVAAGGYEQMSLWDRSIWTAVLELIDRTGTPGPSGWIDGCYLDGEEDHPVTGVSWYEAAAYARWVGKRLPTDAEWVKAGAWPTPNPGGSHTQRRYPWGEVMDRGRANVWGSGPNRVVPVHQFTDGVSVGGVYQLIGNTWEWTTGNYRGADHPLGPLALSEPIKSLRGGAFDTYFDNQVTCQYQSGDHPMARKGNVGFRCAVGVCDVLLGQDSEPELEMVNSE
jgi:iron(II)-dependent oxidoreductase